MSDPEPRSLREPPFDLRQLRAFVAVAETGSFRAAARRVHVAQPALSVQVRRLEEALGTRLLARHRRGTEPTETGRLFLEEARRVLAAADRAAGVAWEAARGRLGRLALGFVGSAAYTVLPGLVRRFRKRYPGIDLYLREMTTAEQVRALQEAEIDAGVLRPPVPGERLALRTVHREPLAAVLPARHPLARRRVVPVAQLRDEPFVLFPRELGPGLYDAIVGLCLQAGFSPRVVQHAVQLTTHLGLVEAGLGVALLPAAVGRVAPPGVACRPLREAAVVELAAAWQRGEEDRPVLRAFLSILD